MLSVCVSVDCCFGSFASLSLITPAVFLCCSAIFLPFRGGTDPRRTRASCYWWAQSCSRLWRNKEDEQCSSVSLFFSIACLAAGWRSTKVGRKYDDVDLLLRRRPISIEPVWFYSITTSGLFALNRYLFAANSKTERGALQPGRPATPPTETVDLFCFNSWSVIAGVSCALHNWLWLLLRTPPSATAPPPSVSLFFAPPHLIKYLYVSRSEAAPFLFVNRPLVCPTQFHLTRLKYTRENFTSSGGRSYIFALDRAAGSESMKRWCQGWVQLPRAAWPPSCGPYWSNAFRLDSPLVNRLIAELRTVVLNQRGHEFLRDPQHWKFKSLNSPVNTFVFTAYFKRSQGGL